MKMVLDFTSFFLLSRLDELESEALNVAGRVRDVKDQGLNLAHLRLIVHVVHEVALALDAAKSNLADLLRVEVLPCLVVHVLEEGHDVDGVHEIDEGIADVTAVVQIKGQVEEVVAPFVKSVNSLKKHLLRVLVGDVANHNCRAPVLPLQNSVKIHLELWVGEALLLLLAAASK